MKHFGDQIQAYVSDEMSPDARREMEAHLATCSACARALDEHRRLWEALAQAPAAASGASVWPAVQARTTGADRGWFFGGSRWVRSGLAAGTVAAGLLLGMMVPGGGGVGAGEALATDLDEAETLWISGTTLEAGQSDLSALWFLDETTTEDDEEGQDS